MNHEWVLGGGLIADDRSVYNEHFVSFATDGKVHKVWTRCFSPATRSAILRISQGKQGRFRIRGYSQVGIVTTIG